MWGSTFIEEEDANKIFDNMISEEYILKACDVSSVEGLTSVKLVIDTSYQSLLDLGDIVKSLETLTLDGSYISSVRDLGTGLRGLLRLSLDNCGLSELDGIGMLSNLIDLSVRDNQVSDITSLAMHETIQVGYMYIYGDVMLDHAHAKELLKRHICEPQHKLALIFGTPDKDEYGHFIVDGFDPLAAALDGGVGKRKRKRMPTKSGNDTVAKPKANVKPKPNKAKPKDQCT
jgi:Leucine-rich repeat (LRR) protein